MYHRSTLLNDEEKISAAEQVFSLLEKTAEFMLADRILMYHSLPDELSTHSFIKKWCDRKHFYLPRVNGVNLEILPYDESRLSLGSFHIEEPTGTDTSSVDDMELIVVPAVAYDRSGNRVGRGSTRRPRRCCHHPKQPHHHQKIHSLTPSLRPNYRMQSGQTTE